MDDIKKRLNTMTAEGICCSCRKRRRAGTSSLRARKHSKLGIRLSSGAVFIGRCRGILKSIFPVLLRVLTVLSRNVCWEVCGFAWCEYYGNGEMLLDLRIWSGTIKESMMKLNVDFGLGV